MKIISVLTYPFKNQLVAKVTRADGYFTFPQITKTYSIPYDSKILDSFSFWLEKLHLLNHNRIVTSLKEDFILEKINGDKDQ
jgi:hypothetical protein